MLTHLLRPILFFALFLTSFSLQAQSLNDNWDTHFDLPGVRGTVEETALDANGNLYVIGNLFGANGLPIQAPILGWNGTEWFSPGLATDTLIADGDTLTLGYTYTHDHPLVAAGTRLYTIAKSLLLDRAYVISWNGTRWNKVGEYYGTIHTLAVHGSNLYAGGNNLQIPNEKYSALVRWDGTRWTPVGNVGNGTPVNITHLAFDDQGNIYATGTFSGSVQLSNAEGGKWDGTTWTPFGNGTVNRNMKSMAAFGSTLYGFSQGERSIKVYRLDGGNWDSISTDLERTYDITSTQIGIDSLSGIYLAARPRSSTMPVTTNIFRWSGNTWNKLPGSIDGAVTSFAFDKSEKFFVAGSFTFIDDMLIANSVAEWDGNKWKDMPSSGVTNHGLVGEVFTLTEWDGYVYAGGTGLKGTNIQGRHGIVRRGGDGAWEPLDKGVNGTVQAIIPNPAGGILVGGCFDKAGDLSVSNVALWDGTEWHPVGAGLSFCVADVAIANGTIYAAGESSIAQWNGSGWTTLAEDIRGSIFAVAATNDGTVYVGGTFYWAGSLQVNNIARWKNGTWSALGSGLSLYRSSNSIPGSVYPEVRSLAVDNDYLYVGGAFDSAGSKEAYNVARWDGSNWSSMYTGLTGGTLRGYSNLALEFPPFVWDIAVTDDFVIAGGNFHIAGKWWQPSGMTSYAIGSGVAFWDKKEEHWNSLGSGVEHISDVMPIVRGVAISHDTVWLGGSFITAAGRNSYNVASVTIPSPHIDQPAGSTAVDFGQIAIGEFFDSVLTITNPATSTRTMSGRVEVTNGPFTVASGATFGVAPGGTVLIPLRFSPTSLGPVAGTAVIHHNATSGQQDRTVSLSGTGIARSINYTITPPGIDFGTYAQNIYPYVNETIRIANLSTSNATFSLTALPLSTPFTLSAYDWLGKPVSPLGTMILPPGKFVTFGIKAQLGIVGEFNQEFVLTHNSTGGELRIPIHLLVTSRQATIEITPPLLEFGDVKIGKDQSLPLTVQNKQESNVPLNYQVNAPSAPFSVSNAGVSKQLAPGVSSMVSVTFTPESEGDFETIVTLVKTVEGNSVEIQIPAHGRGVPGVISPHITPAEIDFGSVSVGNKGMVDLIFSNLPDATLPFEIQFSSIHQPFSFAASGSMLIQPGVTTSYPVTFTPKAIGTYRDTIVITHNGPGLENPVRIPVYGTSMISGVSGDKNIVGENGAIHIEPNPSSSQTHIRLLAPASANAILTIHSIDGREIARLIDGRITAGEHIIEWNAQSVESGVYICRLTQGEFTTTQTIVVGR